MTTDDSTQTGTPTPSTTETIQYEQIYQIIEENGFTIEEGLLEYNIPTFYITPKPNTGEAFLKLYRQLDKKGLAPVLRKRGDKTTLQIVPKPPIKPTRPTTNIVLLLITMATLFITGYILSLGWTENIPNPTIGAIMFTVAIMSILGAHEMAHKLAANKHGVEATYPYFIPGLPLPIGIGTFGAVIQQKSLAPNKDALFDLGISGPIVGFIITIIVTLIGVQMSQLTSKPPEGAALLPVPLLFELLVTAFPPSGNGNIIMLHPVAFAGWVGMVVTMLNLVPVGQLDGGHVARAVLKDTTRTNLAFISIAVLFIFAWPWALIAFFLLRYRDPGPLDDVSRLSNSRKLAAIILIIIFVLTATAIWPIFSIF